VQEYRYRPIVEKREESPDLKTGITEQIFHAAEKIPSAKEHERAKSGF